MRSAGAVWVGLLAGVCWAVNVAVAGAAPPRTAAPSGAAELDAMDTRTPVPMLPMMAHHQKQNMQDHLRVVQEVVAALALGDFAGVEKSATRMGYSEQMGRMCQHMGAATPGFSEAALAFHHAADGIADAARRKDAAAVQTALGQTLGHCTACHATYKQKVVTAEEYRKLTGGTAPAGHGKGH